jgi:hypothetical protein
MNRLPPSRVDAGRLAVESTALLEPEDVVELAPLEGVG